MSDHPPPLRTDRGWVPNMSGACVTPVGVAQDGATWEVDLDRVYKRVLADVAEVTGVGEDAIQAPGVAPRRVSYARWAAYWITRELTRASYVALAHVVGREQGSVYYGCSAAMVSPARGVIAAVVRRYANALLASALDGDR